MRYQIRTNGHGVALVEAESPMKALLKYVEEHGGDVLDVRRGLDPNAIKWKGTVYYTEPPK